MLVAVAQFTSSPHQENNWRIAASLIEDAARQGAKLIVLPEFFGFMRISGQDPIISEPLQGPTFDFLSGLARKFAIWIVGGTYYRHDTALPAGKYYNTSLLIDDQGNLVNHYDKIHLVTSTGGSRGVFSEAKYLAYGTRQWVQDTPFGQLGVAVCYDLRFPESVRGLAMLGAQVVAAPSAFFVRPGERQWEAIIRTRAIENQCYMLVGAQWGEYAPNRHALGFSMIVDPMGDVLAKCEPGQGIALANINPAWVAECRNGIDYLQQARMLPEKIAIKAE